VASPFFAHGIIFKPDTEQVLLYKAASDVNGSWSLVGGLGQDDESPEKAFQRAAQEVVQLRLAASDIVPVYDYFHTSLDRHQHVYVVYTRSDKPLAARKGYVIAWFSFKEITKLGLDPQIKQDIIVSQRVINAKVREIAAEIAEEEARNNPTPAV